MTEEAFVANKVETRIRKRVDSISVIYDRARGELDVVTLGGKRFRHDVAVAFFAAFALSMPSLQRLMRRKINFSLLALKSDLVVDDRTHFEHAFVDEIRVRSPNGLLLTFDAKGKRAQQVDVYDIASRDLRENSPFVSEGWTVVSARILFVAHPKGPGRKARYRTVDLKANGHTNLREQDDIDRHIADECLTKWGILEPAEDDGDGE